MGTKTQDVCGWYLNQRTRSSCHWQCFTCPL